MSSYRARPSYASCAGFTLVELGLCILVIGILLTAVLKSGAVIDSARTKAVLALAKEIKQASHVFKERYYFLPGDLPNAASRMPTVATACSYAVAATGNGVIDSGDEQSCAVDHLFAAGLLKGEPDTQNAGRYLPFQTAYGRAWLSSSATSGVSGLPDTIQNVVVFSKLPCETALQVDRAFDNGDLGTGRARGSVATCTPGGVNDPMPLLAIPL